MLRVLSFDNAVERVKVGDQFQFLLTQYSDAEPSSTTGYFYIESADTKEGLNALKEITMSRGDILSELGASGSIGSLAVRSGQCSCF